MYVPQPIHYLSDRRALWAVSGLIARLDEAEAGENLGEFVAEMDPPPAVEEAVLWEAASAVYALGIERDDQGWMCVLTDAIPEGPAEIGRALKMAREKIQGRLARAEARRARDRRIDANWEPSGLGVAPGMVPYNFD